MGMPHQTVTQADSNTSTFLECVYVHVMCASVHDYKTHKLLWKLCGVSILLNHKASELSYSLELEPSAMNTYTQVNMRLS